MDVTTAAAVAIGTAGGIMPASLYVAIKIIPAVTGRMSVANGNWMSAAQGAAIESAVTRLALLMEKQTTTLDRQTSILDRMDRTQERMHDTVNTTNTALEILSRRDEQRDRFRGSGG